MYIAMIPGGGIMGSVLASMLINVYNFLYQPNSIMSVFTEFDEYVMKIYRDGAFGSVYKFFRTIGVGLLVVGFIVTLMDKVSEGDFSINNFFRHLLKYVMLYIILSNSIFIFEGLLNLTTEMFISIENTINGSVIANSGTDVNYLKLATGIENYVTLTAKIGMFIMLIIPFVVSVLFSVIIYFFSASRLIELSIRIALAPLVAGMSYFGHGANMDIVRYAKRTLGLSFQIVVILIAITGVTVVHNALISSNEEKSEGQIVNPASYLEDDSSYTEINVKELNVEKKTDESGNEEISKVTEGDSEWKNTDGLKVEDIKGALSYSKESIYKFITRIIDPADFFVSAGVMLAALFLIFKSRALSSQLFM